MESLRAVVASLRSQIAVLEDALAEARRKEMGDIKGRFEIEYDEEADDGSGRGVQTCISGISDNAGFYMAWTPRSEPDDPVDGFKIELDELELLARKVWEGYMDVLNAARKPPYGY
ncbi:hypothetical protein Pmar_PMAR013785, partial [Perkinsus marinus ATCC 50983]